jgi:hypothetical protein
MTNEIRELFDRLRLEPFPELGKRIGDFPLYESLLAGCAQRASRNEVVSLSEIPVPDKDTSRSVDDLRRKGDRSEEEGAFLQYFDLLEQIRLALHQEGLP